MQAKIKVPSAWKSLPFKNVIYFSILIDFLVIFAIAFLRSDLPPIVPLLYGRPTGENQLVPSLALATAPLSSLLIIVINVFLSSLSKSEFTKKIYIISAFLLSILSTITVLKIIFLVGFF